MRDEFGKQQSARDETRKYYDYQKYKTKLIVTKYNTSLKEPSAWEAGKRRDFSKLMSNCDTIEIMLSMSSFILFAL